MQPKIMNLPLNLPNLVMCSFILPKILIWGKVTKEEDAYAMENLFKINAPSNDFEEAIGNDEMIENDIEEFGNNRMESDRTSSLHSRIVRDTANTLTTVPQSTHSPQCFDYQATVSQDVEAFEYPYDYENFHREYFDYIWDRRNDSKMEISKTCSKFEQISPFQKNYVCLPDDWQTGIGAIALYCTLQRGSSKGFTNAEFSRLGQIFKFWAIVYLVAGGTFWMICGWCCCCLQCRIFNPDEIRKEARSYVINNPPGIMRNMEAGNQIEYTPTQEEKKAHKELEIKAFAFV